MRGRKPLLIFLIVPLLFLLYSCGGGGSGSSYNPPADTPGLPYSLSLLPSQIIAQTNSSIILNAKVLDGNGVPVVGIPVTFTNLSEPFGVIKKALTKLHLIKSIGILSATVATTNSLGIASVSISSTTVGFATVQAEISNSVGISRAKKTLFFALSVEPQAPPPPSLILSVVGGDNILFKSSGDNERQIKAVVFDGFGSPAPIGTDVTFGADLPFRTSVGGTCSDGSTSCLVTFPNGNIGKTNQLGEAFTTVQVTPTSLTSTTTVLNITASATVDNQSAFNLISLFLSPVTISGASSSLSALPTVVEVNKTSAITAGVVLTTGGLAPDGTTVNFSATCGSIDPFGQTTSGKATATFTAPSTVPSGGICTVSASAAGVAIGSPVNITITAPATQLAVVPGSVTVASGSTPQTVSFTISGGTPSYTTTSTDPTKAFNDNGAGAHAGNGVLDADENGIWSGSPITVTIPANTAAGDVTLNIFDSVGGTTTAKITIIGGAGAGAAMAVAPTSVSVTGMSDTSDQVTFVITGGTSPFVVFSDNTAVVPNPTVSGSAPFTFTINPNPVAASTSVGLTVLDNVGATAKATVTVTPATSSLALNPSTIAVTAGADIAFTIIGGTPGYKVYTSDIGILTITGAVGSNPLSTSGPTFTAHAVAKGSATVTVVDSDNKTVTATVTVNEVAVPPTPDFLIGCDASVTVPNPSTRTFLCTLTSQNGFSAPVTLTCPDLPAGTTCTGFNPASPVTPAANLTTSVIVTIANAGTVGPISPTFHVLGISGSLSHTAPVTLTVP